MHIFVFCYMVNIFFSLIKIFSPFGITYLFCVLSFFSFSFRFSFFFFPPRMLCNGRYATGHFVTVFFTSAEKWNQSFSVLFLFNPSCGFSALLSLIKKLNPCSKCCSISSSRSSNRIYSWKAWIHIYITHKQHLTATATCASCLTSNRNFWWKKQYPFIKMLLYKYKWNLCSVDFILWINKSIYY